jgi:proteic killer suppression protein
MIQSFRHRGLKNFYEKDNPKGLRADQVDKIARILSRLDEADRVAGMDLPGFKLHPLKRNLKGFWAVSVSGNWRIIFRFEGGHAYDVDLGDYH